MDKTCIYCDSSPLSEPKCLASQQECNGCKARLEGFGSQWKDPLVVLDRDREQTHSLRNLLAGRSAFLLCGGPSANDEPLELLVSKGMWTLAVNNVAGHPRVRPQAFVCSDPPCKFSHSIWLDPGIMKFIPTPKLTNRGRGQLRKKENGEFSSLGKTVLDCPNVWGFQRHSWLKIDDSFLSSDGACWGNHQKGADATAQPKTVCTMLLAIRLLYYLGAKTIYLVGVDFTMTPEYGYSFGQARDAGASSSNNAQFRVVNQWLVDLVEAGVFQRFGLSIYNTYANSGLRAFPYAPFSEAIEQARGIIEPVPDLANWYDPRK